MVKILNSKYAISKDGTVTNTNTGKTIKPQDNGNGYKKVTLTIDGNQVQKYIHRLVAEAYLINKSIQVNHKDGDKSNNHVDNLEWVTNSENQKHAHRIGLKKNGNLLWNGKFSKQDIYKIRELDKKGIKRYLIAKEMCCSKSTISDILNNKRYLYFALTGEELTLDK